MPPFGLFYFVGAEVSPGKKGECQFSHAHVLPGPTVRPELPGSIDEGALVVAQQERIRELEAQLEHLARGKAQARAEAAEADSAAGYGGRRDDDGDEYLGDGGYDGYGDGSQGADGNTRG